MNLYKPTYDKVSWVNDMTENIANRILMGEKYLSMHEYDEANDMMVEYLRIPLPSPQRTGTLYQQITYARLKARPIAESIAP